MGGGGPCAGGQGAPRHPSQPTIRRPTLRAHGSRPHPSLRNRSRLFTTTTKTHFSSLITGAQVSRCCCSTVNSISRWIYLFSVAAVNRYCYAIFYHAVYVIYLFAVLVTRLYVCCALQELQEVAIGYSVGSWTSHCCASSKTSNGTIQSSSSRRERQIT